jgi:hypothetical protein
MKNDEHALPQAGGSYVRDAKSGKLTRKAFTAHETAPAAAPAAAPAEPETPAVDAATTNTKLTKA